MNVISNLNAQGSIQESLSGADWWNIKPQVLPHATSNKLSWRDSLETIVSESIGMEASTSMQLETIAVIANDTPGITEVRKAICQIC